MSNPFRALCTELLQLEQEQPVEYTDWKRRYNAAIARTHAALSQPEPVVLTRPDCFNFAMDFLGGTEEVEVRNYIERLESAASAAQPEPVAPTLVYRYSPVTVAECGGPCEQGPQYCDCGEIKGEPAPEPVAPTDEEIMELMPQQMRDDLANAARALAGFDRNLLDRVEPKDLTQIALQMLFTIERMELIIPEITDTIRKALEQSRPTVEPMPVAERPWEREGWCDAEGQCWMGDPGGAGFIPSWRLCRPGDAPSMTCSLPANALPTPEATNA